MTREELLKIAKPILFNTEMVQAILEGRKTVTRRIIPRNWFGQESIDKNDSSYLYFPDEYGDYHHAKDLCRHQPGDILYVRETWQEGYKGNVDGSGKPILEYLYRASGDDISVGFSNGKWKPSIHMPKKAARIFLKVTVVRVERLQDINTIRHDDILKEGLVFHEDISPIKLFKNLWNSTIKKQDLDRYGWDANPWVWVIEFERVEEDLKW